MSQNDNFHIEPIDTHSIPIDMKAFEFNSYKNIYYFDDERNEFKDFLRDKHTKRIYEAPTKEELKEIHSKYIKLN
jgi:hypothetical protein